MFFLSYKYYFYISLKKIKINKARPTKKNKPIKYSHVKKITLKLLKKIKHLFYSNTIDFSNGFFSIKITW